MSATQNSCKLTFEDKNCKLTCNGKAFLEAEINNLYELMLYKSKD